MTANTSKVNGFRPVRYLNGAPYTGKVRAYVIPVGDGTATFKGDLVKLDGTGDASLTGVASVIQAAATDAVIGVIVDFAPNGGTAGTDFMSSGAVNLDTPVYRAASTRRICYVCDDPNVIFEVQEDAVGGALTYADVGLNASVIVGAGSTTTGNSGMQLDSSTAATTATFTLRIMGFTNRPGNDFATTADTNSKVLVKLNNHQLGSSTGVAGV